MQGWFCWFTLRGMFSFAVLKPRCSASWPVWTRRIFQGHLHSIRGAEAFSHGPECSVGHRDSAVAVRYSVVDVPVVRVVHSQVPSWRRHSCSHGCSSLRKCRDPNVFPSLVDTPRVLGIMAGTAQNGQLYSCFALVPWLSSGPRCSASWSVWTRRTVTQGGCGHARNLIGSCMFTAGFAVMMHLMLCSFDWRQAQGLGHMMAVFRALHRHMARVDPAIRAGKEWRGRRESGSQAFCHPDSKQAAVWRGQTRHRSKTSAPPPPPPKAQPGCSVFVVPFLSSADVAHAESAAKRRRERRLRAMLRHERWSVAMALAEFTHHSSRGQRTARAWEEVENTTHDGLRAQKTPPPEERPGCLSDPGPQRSDRTVRHSAGEAPSLLPPSLADAVAQCAAARRPTWTEDWHQGQLGEVHVKYDAPRRQKTPPPGERHGSLF